MEKYCIGGGGQKCFNQKKAVCSKNFPGVKALIREEILFGWKTNRA